MKILVAEDDENSRLLTVLNLKTHYEIFEAKNGEEAFSVFEKERPNLAVLDVMMPRVDGFSLAKKIRERQSDFPIIFLTARQTISDKRAGFSLGADDYITKPVNYEELLLRIEAILRRAKITAEEKISVGKTVMEKSTLRFLFSGKEVLFPKKEFELLYLLLSWPARIFTKDELMEKIWGNDCDSDEATVKSHFSKIRSRLSNAGVDDFEIVSVRGLGYKCKLRVEN